jgi:hypothetical protein
MMNNQHKPFHVKKELFTEYTVKNRALLEIIKRERRKIISEKILKKAAKNNNIIINTEKDKKNYRSNFNKTTKSKIEFTDRTTNNFTTKNKFANKTGGYGY